MSRNHFDPEQIKRWRVAAVLLLCVAAFLAAFAVVHYRKASALLERGRTTPAKVIEVTQRSKRGITTSYELTTVFEADGQPATAKVLVGVDLGERLWNERGSSLVQITYLPDDPTSAVLADPEGRAIGHSDAIERYTGFLLAAPIALAGLFLLFWCRRLSRKTDRPKIVRR